MKNLSIIVAKAKNNVIGKDNDLPWRLSSDLKQFRKITMGKPIVMGRKTHESIGRPLPGRENIILTSDRELLAEGCTILYSIEDLLDYIQPFDETMIMGGATLYEQFLPLSNRLYITEVDGEPEGDTWFPEFDPDLWKEVSRDDYKADDKNDYDYSFVILDKKT